MKKTATKAKKKAAPILFITGLDAAERIRVEKFAEALNRPVSWVTRDALTCYLDALEGEVEALREKLKNPTITLAAAGKTPLPGRGRPFKK